MNCLWIVASFIAVCNAASLTVMPAGRTVFETALPSVSVMPSLVRSAVSPMIESPVVQTVLRSVAPTVLSSVVPVSVSDVELADWQAYKVIPKCTYEFEDKKTFS